PGLAVLDIDAVAGFDEAPPRGKRHDAAARSGADRAVEARADRLRLRRRKLAEQRLHLRIDIRVGDIEEECAIGVARRQERRDLVVAEVELRVALDLGSEVEVPEAVD